eukprot:335299-Pyramimonas_sp.AAC.1
MCIRDRQEADAAAEGVVVVGQGVAAGKEADPLQTPSRPPPDPLQAMRLVTAEGQAAAVSTTSEEEGNLRVVGNTDRSSPSFVASWIQRHTPPDAHARLAQVVEEECIDGAPAAPPLRANDAYCYYVHS